MSSAAILHCALGVDTLLINELNIWYEQETFNLNKVH